MLVAQKLVFTISTNNYAYHLVDYAIAIPSGSNIMAKN
jgi:hypothetical protein